MAQTILKNECYAYTILSIEKKKIMFGLFKKDPIKKLEKEYEEIMLKAMNVQRSGDLKAYAKLIEESEAIQDKIAELQAQKK